MQRVIQLDSASADKTLILKDPINIDGDLHLPALFSYQLLYPLPTRVIEIMSMYRGFADVSLGAVDSHPIRMVPLKMARSVFPGHIAVGIVFVSKDCGSDGQGAKAIVIGN